MSKRRRRDTNAISNADIVALKDLTNLFPYKTEATTSVFNDKRFYNPTRKEDSIIVGSSLPDVRKQSVVQSKRSKVNQWRPQQVPNYVFDTWYRDAVVCRRRKERQEVMIAKGLGSGRRKKPRFNSDSLIKCKRR